MFERFTYLTRRTISLAQENARVLGHDQIGTEHLLLGLAENDGVAAAVLRDHGLTFDAVRDRVLAHHPEGASAQELDFIPLSKQAKYALELTFRESLNLGHSHIGTEHLLLGISRENAGIGAVILNEFFGRDSLHLLRREALAKAATHPDPEADKSSTARSVAAAVAADRAVSLAGDLRALIDTWGETEHARAIRAVLDRYSV